MMFITATDAVLDHLRPVEPVLTRQIRIGRPVDELAVELVREGSAGRLTVEEVEAGLWTFVRDELIREADAYGRQMAVAAGEGADREWPVGRPVNAAAVLRALGQRRAPAYVLRQIDQTVREAYAETRGG